MGGFTTSTKALFKKEGKLRGQEILGTQYLIIASLERGQAKPTSLFYAEKTAGRSIILKCPQAIEYCELLEME